MEIKKYKKFLEDKEINYREDEFSHLNDELNSRWDDSTYDPYEDDPGFRRLHSDDYDDYDYEEDVEMDDDVDGNDMDHLVYLLRTMYKNSDIDVQIEYKGLDIMIYCVMSHKERLKDIITVFEVSNKLKKDILPQYDSEFEMWETKKGQPLLIFNFYYKEGLDDDNMPF